MTISGIECKVLKKIGKKAEIDVEGQTITISGEYLPKSLIEGQALKLYFLLPEEAALQEKKLAKSILEQILNGN